MEVRLQPDRSEAGCIKRKGFLFLPLLRLRGPLLRIHAPAAFVTNGNPRGTHPCAAEGREGAAAA